MGWVVDLHPLLPLLLVCYRVTKSDMEKIMHEFKFFVKVVPFCGDVPIFLALSHSSPICCAVMNISTLKQP